MSKTTVTALFAIAGCLLAPVTGCENPATGKPEAEVTDVDADAGPPAGIEGRRFVISDLSTVGFVGSKVTGSHEGGFETFEGTIVLGPDGPPSSKVDVMIDTTSLWADNDRLTGHLKSPDFFDVESHPTARFTSTGIAAAEDGYMITGQLELHGVTRQITFPAAIEVQDDRITANAEFFIQRFDFGIVYPGKPDDLIRDEVVVRLDLVAVPEDDEV